MTQARTNQHGTRIGRNDSREPWMTMGALAAFVEKQQLDLDRYINVHASAAPQTTAELMKAVGK